MKTWEMKLWLLNEAGEFEGGGGESGIDMGYADDPGVEGESGEDGNEDDIIGDVLAGDESEGGRPSAGGKAPIAQIDTEGLANAIMRGMQGAQPKNQPQAMSDEDFRKLTKHFAVTEDLVTKLFDENAKPADRMTALQMLIDGAVTHATHISAYQSRFMREELMEQLNPVLSEHQKAQGERFIDSVVKTYPVLGKNRQLIAMAAQQVARTNANLSGLPAIKAVASVAESVIRQTVPQFALAAARNQSGRPKMAGGLGNGMGGANPGASTQAGKKEGFRSLFPARAK